MVSKSKLYKKLGQLEAELEEQLVPRLENAAKRYNDLVFCVSAFNPFPELKSRTDKVTEELVEIGSQVIALKKKLGEATEGSIAERICWYCREWRNIKNSHRKTSQGLALQFLEEISNVRRTT